MACSHRKTKWWWENVPFTYICIFMYVFLNVKSAALQGQNCWEPCSSLCHLIFMGKLDCACYQGKQGSALPFQQRKAVLFHLSFCSCFEFSSDYNQPGNGFLRGDTISQNIIISFQEENYELGSGLEVKSACCIYAWVQMSASMIKTRLCTDLWFYHKVTRTAGAHWLAISSGLVGDLVLKK